MLKNLIYTDNGLLAALNESSNICEINSDELNNLLMSLKKEIKEELEGGNLIGCLGPRFIKNVLSNTISPLKDVIYPTIKFKRYDEYWHKLKQHDITVVFRTNEKIGCAVLANYFGDIVYYDYTKITLKEYLKAIVINLKSKTDYYFFYGDDYAPLVDEPEAITNYIKISKDKDA